MSRGEGTSGNWIVHLGERFCCALEIKNSNEKGNVFVIFSKISFTRCLFPRHL